MYALVCAVQEIMAKQHHQQLVTAVSTVLGTSTASRRWSENVLQNQAKSTVHLQRCSVT